MVISDQEGSVLKAALEDLNSGRLTEEGVVVGSWPVEQFDEHMPKVKATCEALAPHLGREAILLFSGGPNGTIEARIAPSN